MEKSNNCTNISRKSLLGLLKASTIDVSVYSYTSVLRKNGISTSSLSLHPLPSFSSVLFLVSLLDRELPGAAPACSGSLYKAVCTRMTHININNTSCHFLVENLLTIHWKTQWRVNCPRKINKDMLYLSLYKLRLHKSIVHYFFLKEITQICPVKKTSLTNIHV